MEHRNVVDKCKRCNKSGDNECKCLPSYSCDFCRRSYRYLSYLKKHIRWHLDQSLVLKNKSTTKKHYTCNICENTFLTLFKLKIHILWEHQDIEHRCADCQRVFTSDRNMQKHLCRVQNPYQCEFCDETFTQHYAMKKHYLLNHPHYPVYACSFCKTIFMKESSLQVHIAKMNCCRKARENCFKSRPPEDCRKCSLKFNSESELISHFEQSHAGLPFSCYWCQDEEFSTHADLKKHVDLYHGWAAFSCTDCEQYFASKEGLRRHRLKHSEKQFTCRHCDRRLASERGLRCHDARCKAEPKKSRRQLNWTSKIIVKNVRGGTDKESSFPSGEKLCDSSSDDSESEEKGWFSQYYESRDQILDAEDITNSDVDVNQASNARDDNWVKLTDYDSSEESGDDIEQTVEINCKLCRLCQAEFPHEYELLHHFIKTHPGEKPHQCPHCDEVAPLLAQLREHMKTHGIGLGVYHCGQCSKAFNSQARALRHDQKCQQGDIWPGVKPCRSCGKNFQTKCGYKRHKKICKKVEEVRKRRGEKDMPDNFGSGNLKDDSLPGFEDATDESHLHETFNSNESMLIQVSNADQTIQHTDITQVKSESDLIVKSDESFDLEEEDLTKAFAKVEQKENLKELMRPDPSKFPCRFCEASFPYERGLVMHFKVSHPGKKPLICPHCNVTLAEKLKEHLKTHGIGEEFICGLCDKRFNQKFLSKIHELWHQGIEHKCENCKQKFLTADKMRQHTDSGKCHGRESLMILPCDACGRRFKSRHGLRVHYLTHTPKELRPVKPTFNCEFCGKWFVNNSSLVRHTRTHTGEKPFCCRYCPKTFIQSGNCKEHERIHTGEGARRRRKEPSQQPPIKHLITKLTETNPL